MGHLLREVEAEVNRPFDVKFTEAVQLIAHNIGLYGDQTAVAWSGGKDSTVVLFICRQIKPDIKVMYSNTGVEIPEPVEFVNRLEREWDLNLTRTKPVRSFWSCVDQWGWPDGAKHSKRGKAKDHCCYYLKERPAELFYRDQGTQAVFDGVSAVESYARMFWARDLGMCYVYKHWGIRKVHPILWWTPEEVWEYTRQKEIPYNEAYDKGCDRVGCLPCTAYRDWESKLKKINPKMYAVVKLRKDKQYTMKEVL